MVKSRTGGQITRFAPSPTGYLHVGHAFSALTAFNARGINGTFHLRIEDIDPLRCKPEFTDAIFEDLKWLGLGWETPVRKQSEHMGDYDNALHRIEMQGLLYPCFCTRSEIKTEIEKSSCAPHGPDGPIYPGTCRHLSNENRLNRMQLGDPHVYRLDMHGAATNAGPIDWNDENQSLVNAKPELFGDIVLARKDIRTSYHLAVTVDDHIQGITMVTRGVDLAPSTDIHRLLQELLGYSSPTYNHHHLIRDMKGRRLAKRDQDMTIRSLRERGYSPEDVIALTGFEGI
ncbi:MAG: Glutamate--tRNA ligase [Alphaproteobacteria bacterium MarineAlpha11_Bin1]|nr:MAG: Glutamate--tRNA ligase [Alphaproteobacteria bacterium MarineAlpha11_Bin1]